MHPTDHHARAQGDRQSDHAAEQTTTALVRYEGATDAEARVPQTALEAFLDALLARHAGAAAAASGSMHWESFPVREALAAGCWVIVTKFAERYGWPMTSAEQILLALAKIDRYLSCGLVLWYPMTDDAVRAFEKQVIPAAIANIRAAPAGQSMNALECWQLPAAQFLARIAKRTTRYLAELKERAERIEERNVIARGGAKLLHDDVQFDSAQLTPAFVFQHFNADRTEDFPLLQKSKNVSQITSFVESLQALPKQMRRAERLQRALAALPHRLRDVPSDAQVHVGISIEETWVNTQLLLAALDAPDAEFLNASAIGKAVTAIQHIDGAALVSRFLARMSARGATIPPERLPTLHRLLHHRIGQLTLWDAEFSDQQLGSAFVRIDAVTTATMRAGDALEIACGFSMALVEHASAGGDDVYEQFLRVLAKRVPWKQCTVEDIASMTAAEVLSPRRIARGIAQMPKEHRAAATDALQASKRTSATAELLTLGLLGQSITEIVQEAAHLTDAQVTSLLPRIFTQEDTGSEELERVMCPETLIPLVLRAPAEILREIVVRPECRMAVTSFIFYRLVNRALLPDRRFASHVQKFRAFLGKDLWTMYVLAGVLRPRIWEYESFRDNALTWIGYLSEGEQKAELQWDAFRENRYLGKLLQQEPAAVARTLRTHSEEEVYRWLCGADDAAVAEFIAMRDAYHGRMEQEGLAPKPRRAPRKPRKRAAAP